MIPTAPRTRAPVAWALLAVALALLPSFATAAPAASNDAIAGQSRVVSIDPASPHTATIDQAIAKGDLDDVRRHLAADPTSLNRGAKNPALTPLHQAILRKRTEIALFLLEAGADPNLADASRSTPLHLAVQRNNLDIVVALLARKADANLRDQTGWTPLHHAAARDAVAIARALLDGGADIHRLSDLGGTALHEAAASGGAEMIRLLLAREVDAAIVSKTGQTAMDIAGQRADPTIIAALAHE